MDIFEHAEEPTDARVTTSPQAFYGAGDIHDDDGQAIEQPFDHADDNTGKASDFVEAKPTQDTVPITTRILRGFQVLTPGSTTLLMPADRNRRQLVITANGTATNDGVSIASEQDAFLREDNLPIPNQFIAGSGPVALDHNGAVWAHAAAGNTQPVTVVYTSVTV